MSAAQIRDSADGFVLLPAERQEIAAMSRKARQAVLEPADPGGWAVDWRHAVAARICRQHGMIALAEGYLAAVAQPDTAALADPAKGGRDPREAVVLRFVDTVATAPAEIAAGDISGLLAAGVTEPDVVRLCEMAAFLAYQCRVAKGLALLNGEIA